MSLPGLASESDRTEASELRVNMVNMRRSLDAIIGSALARKGFTFFTVNLDHMVKLGQSGPFRDAYARADYITADGWPIVWLARGPDRRKTARPGSVDRRKAPNLERTTGADLLEPMCREAARHGLPLYFIGPSPASQAAGLRILKDRYVGLTVAGAETPQLPAELDAATVDALAARLAQSGARVCVVSLGAPKQEVLADALHRRCPDVGFLCVGAALDFAQLSHVPIDQVPNIGLEEATPPHPRTLGRFRKATSKGSIDVVITLRNACPRKLRRVFEELVDKMLSVATIALNLGLRKRPEFDRFRTSNERVGQTFEA